jgi:hypothetical protein
MSRLAAGTRLAAVAVLAEMLLGGASPAHAQLQPEVPVVIEGGWQYDPCGNGMVVGLDHRGDGWLAVKSGPGLDYKRIDKLYNGSQVYLCGETKQWYAIVYSPRGGTSECNVMKPWPVSLPYTGPCRSGWVYKQYVKVVAG